MADTHRAITHHQKMEKCTRIQQHHLMRFAEYLEKLKNTPDGDALNGRGSAAKTRL